MYELTLTYRGTVYPWQCDHMGHMNVMWYASKFDEASWQLLARLGITKSYLTNSQSMMAAVQQNTTYKRELRAGDIISIRSGISDIEEKVVRFIHEMKNDGTGELAAFSVVTGIHMDFDSRKTSPFPDALLERLQRRFSAADPFEFDITQDITEDSAYGAVLS